MYNQQNIVYPGAVSEGFMSSRYLEAQLVYTFFRMCIPTIQVLCEGFSLHASTFRSKAEGYQKDSALSTYGTLAACLLTELCFRHCGK